MRDCVVLLVLLQPSARAFSTLCVFCIVYFVLFCVLVSSLLSWIFKCIPLVHLLVCFFTIYQEGPEGTWKHPENGILGSEDCIKIPSDAFRHPPHRWSSICLCLKF